MLNPCYDEATHTDCPNRRGGCAVNCKKWAKYCEERNKRYEEEYNKKTRKQADESFKYDRKAKRAMRILQKSRYKNRTGH
jgi:hypothetical protein